MIRKVPLRGSTHRCSTHRVRLAIARESHVTNAAAVVELTDATRLLRPRKQYARKFQFVHTLKIVFDFVFF
jgi:hypothetical protein